MIILQVEVSAFNQNLHLDIVKLIMYNTLEDEIVARGGTTYQERSSTGQLVKITMPAEQVAAIKAVGEEMMNNARETGVKEFDLSEIGDS